MLIKIGFTSVGNTSLYYELSGTGKPLILLHSGIADHRMWAGQLRELSERFLVITPDFRGYGKTPASAELYRHHEDVYEFIRRFGLESANIAGCSLGGKTAIELAISHPEVVDRLILIAPGLAGYEYRDKETLEKDAELETLIAGGNRQEVADILVDIWVVGLKRKRESVSSQARDLVRDMILDNYSSVIDHYPPAKPDFDVISRLGEIRCPALVMIGDSDLPDMQAISQLVAGRIPGARIQMIPDAAHLPNLEHNALFHQSLIDFLSR